MRQYTKINFKYKAAAEDGLQDEKNKSEEKNVLFHESVSARCGSSPKSIAIDNKEIGAINKQFPRRLRTRYCTASVEVEEEGERDEEEGKGKRVRNTAVGRKPSRERGREKFVHAGSAAEEIDKLHRAIYIYIYIYIYMYIRARRRLRGVRRPPAVVVAEWGGEIVRVRRLKWQPSKRLKSLSTPLSVTLFIVEEGETDLSGVFCLIATDGCALTTRTRRACKCSRWRNKLLDFRAWQEASQASYDYFIWLYFFKIMNSSCKANESRDNWGGGGEFQIVAYWWNRVFG